MLRHTSGLLALWGVPPLAVIALGLLTVNSVQVGSIQDDAWYIATATALARGQGFVRPWTPMLLPETSLPPGYPLLLAPLRWFFPRTFFPLQVLSLLAMAATVILCVWYYRRRFEQPVAWLAALFLAVNVGIVQHSNVVMSEAAYTFLGMAVIVLQERREVRADFSLRFYVLIGVLASGVFLVRAWGLALVAALVIYSALRRRWTGAAVVSAIFVAVYALGSLRNAMVGGVGVSYGFTPATAPDLVARLARDLPDKLVRHWLYELGSWFYTPRMIYSLELRGLAWLEGILATAVLLVIIVGFVSLLLRRQAGLAELYAMLYATILSLAPNTNRYWVPLLPLLVVYFIKGAQAIVSLLPVLRRPRVTGAVMVIMLICAIGLHVRRDLQDFYDPPRLRATDIATGPTWLKHNSPPGAVTMAAIPRVSYIYADRPLVPFPDGGGELYPAYPNLASRDKIARFKQALDAFPVSYVLVEPVWRRGELMWTDYTKQVVVPTLEADRERFRLVFTDNVGLVRVYEVKR